MKTILATAAAVLLACPAIAQQQCGPRDAVAAYLGGEYSEQPRAMMLTGSGAVLQVWANEATGTWSVTTTSPAGVTCLIADGIAFDWLAAEPEGIDG